MLQPQELRDYYLKIKEINRKFAQEGKRIKITTGCEAAIFNEETLADSPFNRTILFCNAVRGGQLNIMANGDILPCRRFPVVVGNALKDNLYNVYYSEQMQDFRNLEKLSSFCKKCQNFSNCFGGAKCVTYAYTGKWDIPDVQCWRAYKKLGDPPPILQVKEKEDKSFALNKYFPFPLDTNNILLTTKHGGWAILNKEDYDIVKSNNLYQNLELFKNLEKVGIILTQKSIQQITFILRQQNRFLSYHPAHHVIAITDKCNLNCNLITQGIF